MSPKADDARHAEAGGGVRSKDKEAKTKEKDGLMERRKETREEDRLIIEVEQAKASRRQAAALEGIRGQMR